VKGTTLDYARPRGIEPAPRIALDMASLVKAARVIIDYARAKFDAVWTACE
jgi:hypothetical protein